MTSTHARRRFIAAATGVASTPIISACGAGESVGAADLLSISEHGLQRAGTTRGNAARRAVQNDTPAIDAPSDGNLITNVLLSPDRSITPSRTEFVTFGLPLAPNRVANPDQIRVTQNGTEIPISCVTGLKWHHLGGAPRSVTIQCVVDLSRGDIQLRIDDAGRNTRKDSPIRPVELGWMDSGYRDPDGRVLLAPRIYALPPLKYLASTALLPPYLPPESDDAANHGFWATAVQFLDSFPYSGKDYSAWLFDRATALFKLSLQIHDVEKRKRLLKHAAISKLHYFNYVMRTQYASTAEWIAEHWWDFKRQAGDSGSAFSYGTTMYQYCQNAKLALALLGDGTQWNSQMLIRWAADIRRAPGTPGPDFANGPDYVYPGSWSERLAGLCSTFHLNAWELTGDPGIRRNLDQRVGYLKRMQQTHRPHEMQNGWPASSGVFRHSWAGHDGSEVPDRVASAVQDYPAGTVEIIVRTALSDFDMQRFVGKGFNFAGTPGVDLVSAAKRPDGTWVWILGKPLNNPISPTSAINARTNINIAPHVEADQAFSPWMSVFVCDFLWQYYHLFGGADAAEILRRLGNAINERGFLSVINEDLSFTQDVVSYGGRPWRGFNRAGPESFPLYLCSDIAPRNVIYHAGFMDLHTELILAVAVARVFETDDRRKRRLEARLKKIEFGLFHEKAVFSPNPLRTLNWQHQAMPFRTWKWVESMPRPLVSVESGSSFASLGGDVRSSIRPVAPSLPIASQRSETALSSTDGDASSMPSIKRSLLLRSDR